MEKKERFWVVLLFFAVLILLAVFMPACTFKDENPPQPKPTYSIIVFDEQGMIVSETYGSWDPSGGSVTAATAE